MRQSGQAWCFLLVIALSTDKIQKHLLQHRLVLSFIIMHPFVIIVVNSSLGAPSLNRASLPLASFAHGLVYYP